MSEHNGNEFPPAEETKRDTETPPPGEHHGFLEQFETLTHASFAELEQVVSGGLQSAERLMLVKVSLKLLTLAVDNLPENFDFSPDEKSELETAINTLLAIPLPL